MIAVPVSAFLVQLSSAGQPQDSLQFADEPETSPDERDAMLRAEFLRGLQQGRSEAEEAFAAERTSIIEEQAAIAAARARETAVEFAARLDSSFANLSRSVSESVGQLLRPFIERAIKAEAFADLLSKLREILASDSVPMCVVQAPEEYRAAFMELFEDKVCRIDFRASEAREISVRIDQQVVETRIAEWISAIEASR